MSKTEATFGRSQVSDVPFYKDHWVNIEQERLDRYSTMFEWSPASRTLYEPADIRTGHVIDVQVITRPDMTGRLLPMNRNMAGYAMECEDFNSTVADESLAALERALEEKTYLVLAPQFVVTAAK